MRPGKQHRCSGLYPFSLHEARKTTPLQRFISFLLAQGQENNTVAAVYILSPCLRPEKQHRCSGLYPFSLPKARKTKHRCSGLYPFSLHEARKTTPLQRFISFLLAQGQENNIVAAVYILSHCMRPGKQHRCSGLYPFSLPKARKTTPLQRFISFLLAQGQENNIVAAVYILSHCMRPGKQHRCSGLYPFSLPKARKTTPLQRFISFLIA